MEKWIWTFGCGTRYAGKYVIVNTDDGDGREIVFSVFGRKNCSFPYPYDKGMEIVKKYGYELIGIITTMQIINNGYDSGYNLPKHDENYELMEDNNG